MLSTAATIVACDVISTYPHRQTSLLSANKIVNKPYWSLCAGLCSLHINLEIPADSAWPVTKTHSIGLMRIMNSDRLTWWTLIHEINHIWTAEMKWKSRNDRRSERNLCNCAKKPEKNSGLQRGLNPWPRDYRCDALPTELWSHWRWEQVNCGFICFRERNEC